MSLLEVQGRDMVMPDEEWMMVLEEQFSEAKLQDLCANMREGTNSNTPGIDQKLSNKQEAIIYDMLIEFLTPLREALPLRSSQKSQATPMETDEKVEIELP